MERTLLKELTKANIEAYVNSAREAYLKRLFWDKFFPLKLTTQLKWESLTGSAGNPVMADVVEYNATAPIKTRRIVTKASGDIPKIAIKRSMDEKDFNDYNTLKASAAGDANKNAILDLCFNDVDFCYQGVLARTEFLCGQALSTGGVSLDTSNNNGKVTEIAVDFGIPSGNKTGVAVDWATAATATPIADIQAKVDAAADLGYTLNYIVMDKPTLRYMLQTTEVKDKFAFFQRITGPRKADVSFSDLNLMLETYMLPQILIWDSKVRFESMGHALTTVPAWTPGRVAFMPDLNVGNVLHGPIAEETSEAVKKISIQVKNQHVLVSKWSEIEPFGEWTKGQANAFPRFTDVNGIFLLRTNNSTWGD
jgi:hypothetical protein